MTSEAQSSSGLPSLLPGKDQDAAGVGSCTNSGRLQTSEDSREKGPRQTPAPMGQEPQGTGPLHHEGQGPGTWGSQMRAVEVTAPLSTRNFQAEERKRPASQDCPSKATKLKILCFHFQIQKALG